jgi:hypothetical protein
MEPLTAPPQSATREGLATLGTPEYAARPTWLAAVPQPSGSTGGGGGSGGGAGGTPPAPNSVPALAKNAAAGGSTPVSLPLWMESAMKLGTRFLRIAAAGVPQAALGFEPHEGEPRTACCRECGCDHPVLIDEYYFWLVDTQYYTYTDQTDTQSNPDSSFAGSSVSRIPTTIRSSNSRRNGTTRIRCRRSWRNGSRIRLQMMGVFAVERAMIRERVKAGLEVRPKRPQRKAFGPRCLIIRSWPHS